MTVTEFASLMGVSRSTIYRWIDRGDVPTFQLGGKTRISLAAVRASLPAVHEAVLDQLPEVCESTSDEDSFLESLSHSVSMCPISA